MIAVTIARNPMPRTTAANCAVVGSGALNIDACRVSTGDKLGRLNKPGDNGWKNSSGGPSTNALRVLDGLPELGRWPANAILVHPAGCREGYCIEGCPVKRVDADGVAVGVHPVGNKKISQHAGSSSLFGIGLFPHNPNYYDDEGGASRFFKCLREEPGMVNKVPQELIDYLITLISPPDMKAVYVESVDEIQFGEIPNDSICGLLVRGQPTDEQAAELKRILMPGAHLLLIAPDDEPTGHTGTCRIEDAGFEIRDSVLWIREAGQFHYVPKASRSEREAGCHNLPGMTGAKAVDRKEDSDGLDSPRAGAGRTAISVHNFHPCLHPDALVLTLRGYRPIMEVKKNDFVFSADGCFHIVDDVSHHPYTSPYIYEIKVQGTNYSTLASDNHPFLIWRPQRKKGYVLGGAVQWVETKDIRKGDYTMTPLCDEHPVYVELDALDYQIPQESEFWVMFGLYLADGVLQRAGHGTHCYPSYSLGTDKPDIIDRVKAYFEVTRGVEVGVYPHGDHAVQVVAFDPKAGELFHKHGGAHAESKTLSPLVTTLAKDIKKSILEGYLFGDGCKVRNRFYRQAKTVSPDLASLLCFIADGAGFRSNLFHYPPSEGKGIGERKFKTTRNTYHLYFYDRNQSRSDRKHSRPTYIDHEGKTYLLRHVKSITPISYEGDVWNLTVQGSPTFQTVVGMSHNTVKPIDLMERLLGDVPKDQGPVLDPFMGSGSTGIACIHTGHDFVGVDREQDYVRIATARVKHWDSQQGYINRTVDSDCPLDGQEQEPVDLWDMED